MASVNKVILVGNLGKDPEVRRLPSGSPVVNLRLATTETWRDKQTGERKEKTEWHSVVIFNEHIARVAEQYLKKGMKVYVEGQLQTRKWQDQSGQDRYSTEVVLQTFRGELQMLESAGSRAASSEDSYGSTRTKPAANPQPQSASAVGGTSKRDDFDDDIPFLRPDPERHYRSVARRFGLHLWSI